MKVPVKKIQNLIRNATFVNVDVQMPNRFAIVNAKPGGAYHINFYGSNHREEYLFLTRKMVKLFCNNEYYGGLLVIYDNGELHKVLVFCARAVAFVLADGNLLVPYITPIDSVADIVSSGELKNPESLREHFEKQYLDLLKHKPEYWEKNFQQLLHTNTTFSIYDNFIDF